MEPWRNILIQKKSYTKLKKYKNISNKNKHYAYDEISKHPDYLNELSEGVGLESDDDIEKSY